MLDKPRLSGYKKCDLLNGDGVCVSVWFQGCNFRCKGCHNPQTWSMNDGEEFTHTKIDEIKSLLDDKYIDGLSFLGGEPLLERNYEIIKELSEYAKEKEKTVYVWTGYDWEEIKHLDILKSIDKIVCGKFILELRNISKYCGSTNQEVIDVQSSLQYEKKIKNKW